MNKVYYDKPEYKQTISVTNSEGLKSMVEIPWDAGVEDWMNAIFGILTAQTFIPSTIIRGMRDFVEEMQGVVDPDYIVEKDPEEENIED